MSRPSIRRPSLENAMQLAEKVARIAYAYQQDKGYVPTRQELSRLHHAVDTIWVSYITLYYLNQQLRRRALHQQMEQRPAPGHSPQETMPPAEMTPWSHPQSRRAGDFDGIA